MVALSPHRVSPIRALVITAMSNFFTHRGFYHKTLFYTVIPVRFERNIEKRP